MTRPELSFEDKILVIADLHLQSAEPDILALALAFFRQAQGARHLYILGDLFEYWIGDDCLDNACFDDNRLDESTASDRDAERVSDPVTVPGSVVSALSKLSQSGTPITVMHGNRDFLLGDAFAAKIGATLLNDESIVLDTSVPGKSIVLMHGDTLCTDDVEYQQFRQQVRDSNWQSAFLAKPLNERETIATALRSGSTEASQKKSIAIMDVNADAVEQVFIESGCQHLIHGHTHRPAVHEHDSGTRVVVGDWHADHAMVGVIGLNSSRDGDDSGCSDDCEIELFRFTMDLVTA